MRLIDADKAKAELLRMVGDIHGWGEFFDGIRSGYQSAADRLDTITSRPHTGHAQPLGICCGKGQFGIKCSSTTKFTSFGICF